MLLKIRDVYDQEHWVSSMDFHNTRRYPRLIPLRDTTGRKIEYCLEPVGWIKGAVRSVQSHIRRENVAAVYPQHLS